MEEEYDLCQWEKGAVGSCYSKYGLHHLEAYGECRIPPHPRASQLEKCFYQDPQVICMHI